MANAFYLAIPLIGVAISVPLMILILRKDHRNAANRVLSLLLLSLGLWGFFIFMMRSSPDTQQALFWDKIAVSSATAILAFYYHFTSIYTQRASKKLLWGSYLFLLTIGILAPNGLIINQMTMESYGYAPSYVFPSLIFVSLGGLFFIGMGLVNLIKAYQGITRYEERTRLIYMIFAIVIFVSFAILDLFPSLPPIGILGNILFSAITAIAIIRYHLLDVHVVFRKSVAYLLMSTLVAVPYVGVIVLFNRMYHGAAPYWTNLVLLLILALFLQPLWNRVQGMVDRLFYMGRYNFLQDLENFSRESHDISDIKQLGSSLVKLLSRALQASSAHLLLLSELGDFTTIASIGKNGTQTTLKSHSPLIRWMQSNNDLLYYHDLDILPQLHYLTATERNELDHMGAELIAPLKTKKGEMIGLILLGKKYSHGLYSEEDKRLVLTVTNRVSVELENARLYALETMMREELQKQDEQKTEFLHSVAHELKTPLTAIISSSDLLDSELSKATPGQKRRLIRNITRSAWSMDRRVTELLDLARVQVGSLKLRLEPLEIGTIIEDVTSQLHPLFKNKDQKLELEIPTFLPKVIADKERVEQILINLLSNANKFSPIESNIKINARKFDTKIVVEVKDSAQTITDAEKLKIFEPYYRGENADARNRLPGLGLGLAISKKLVELQEGEIWVESESGKGNTFAFSLPVYQGE